MYNESENSVSSSSVRLNPDSIASSGLQRSNKRASKFLMALKAFFRYRKTSLTIFVFLSFLLSWLVTQYNSSLNLSITLPDDELESRILEQSWSDLQYIGKYKHPYGAHGNDFVHAYLERKIKSLISRKTFIEYDNDMNYTNKILFMNKNWGTSAVNYYESNNLVVRINGTNADLPALLISAHFDSVPSSFGVTDDGMGVASLLGLLSYYSESAVKRPNRTIILNFNNNEEFGLYGAFAFLSHPWSKQVKYFLNLEGTGAGGKAILFRTTDYGIAKYFKKVRFPFGSSIFQEGFNNHLIHSETDYKVYKENGSLRGLDLAFYRPRDIYHTSRDNIRDTTIKSLWHMLSNALDFVNAISSSKIDIDEENIPINEETAVYSTLFNYMFIFPVSYLIGLNIFMVLVSPIVSIPLFFFAAHRKNWNLNFINIIKYPVSLVLSFMCLGGFSSVFILSQNEFLPNSSSTLMFCVFAAFFILLNYSFLNCFNCVFRTFKGLNHDEKLIVMIQNSCLLWIALCYSTARLFHNKIGNDHSGEYILTILYILQSLGVLFGLLGWSLKSRKAYMSESGEERTLLNAGIESYGSSYEVTREEDDSIRRNPDEILGGSVVQLKPQNSDKKNSGFDWSIQFLLVVPISACIIFTSGSLILEGLSKSIQESLNSEKLVYFVLQIFAVMYTFPFLPFVFKINKHAVLIIAIFFIGGVLKLQTSSAFDIANPLKLRFVQEANSNISNHTSTIKVYGRQTSPMLEVLHDIPSVKECECLSCEYISDGMQTCSYNSTKLPNFSNITSFGDLLNVEVLKNSSSKIPYGLLSGEIKITPTDSRVCKVKFHSSSSIENPVKIIIVYSDKDNATSSILNEEYDRYGHMNNIPEGYSRDENGNYVYKEFSGIEYLTLNKLSWKNPIHIGFQWIPEFTDLRYDRASFEDELKISVDVSCYWSQFGALHLDGNQLPNYEEVLHFSPNYVTWANFEPGLLSVSSSFEI